MNNDKLVIRPKTLKGEDGYKIISLRVSEDLARRLDEISAKTGYSRNALIGEFIEFAIERCVIEEK